MPPHALGSGKEVAESAFEALLTETAAHYSRPGAPLPTRAALESIGFQVGLQLVERCAACAVLRCAVPGAFLRRLRREAAATDLAIFSQLLPRQAALQ